MGRLRAVALLLLLAAVAWTRPADESPDPPPPEPILLEIIGDKTLTIDLMGKTKAAWIKAAREGSIPPLPTGLKLRVRNNLKVPLRVRITGSVPVLTLKLEPKGKGEAISHETRAPAVKGVVPVSYELVQPGKWYDMPLSSLQGFGRLATQPVYPSEAGEWKLTAEFTTALYEQNAMGSFILHKGTLRNTLKSKPVTLTVKEK
jgi:hypothetical protein